MVSNAPERLVLGTAQLGMTYGIANSFGKPERQLVAQILNTAWDAGIRILDTAKIYGDAEIEIGNWHRTHPGQNFKVYTKLDPALKLDGPKEIHTALVESEARLQVTPTGILLHDPSLAHDLDRRIGEVLTSLRTSGYSGSFGISVYTPNEFEEALKANTIQFIQAPFNVFDTRIVDQGLLEKAKSANKPVFIRSVFLQGLATMAPDQLSKSMSFAASNIGEWDQLCRKYEREKYPTALKFAFQNTGETHLLIGCETVQQLEDDLAALATPKLPDEINQAILAMTDAPERMINPAHWP